ncbi:hypothetical protein QAD02_014300 [Eretmocerus hayati]|uniref:Uncharacterized protein n=1 Tax=Eretmocerus hayati TaxID=131215 RepID=A0ACC2P5Z5_9HYME|nr:hypothetical protein QAD02_014300 [Eretmocerus hayati]
MPRKPQLSQWNSNAVPAPAPTTLPIPTFSTATPVPATTGNPTVASRVSPGWTLRRRPDYSRGASSTDHSASPFESTAASGLIDDQTKLTTAASSKNLRRGNKTFVASSDGQTKAKDGDDSENYPAEFKARLGQPVSFLLKFVGLNHL